ncbi:Translation initiation factor IF-3 [Gimesia fumaroli]|uniref:Translation initiation factor IF-3 n=1 Tax=Gimesia fumaroli TaxID=2527976 RepID=A0A518IKK9_9PLAN|nr:translation initiation factor IF-3 [Gimesia fumaroli]QDV53609.1 Translation initiation factor IF-3 [Gimesia fumaroli]
MLTGCFHARYETYFFFLYKEKQAIETTQRLNDQIRISPVRVIDQDGEQLGVIPTAEALKLAMEANLDLVEVASDAKPPVCRIMDYGKLKYERKKKTSKNTKQHQVQLKEIRMRPKIGKHDIEFKLKSARKFLEQKDKVKFNIMFRGRENAHHELGRTILGGIQEELSEIAKVEQAPTMASGRNMIMVLAPR